MTLPPLNSNMEHINLPQNESTTSLNKQKFNNIKSGLAKKLESQTSLNNDKESPTRDQVLGVDNPFKSSTPLR